MIHTLRWHQEPGARIQASRPLDNAKLQAPGIVRLPGGGYRMFYTAVGTARPFPECQGYILSAVSDDGLTFRTETGIRVRPQPEISYMSRRVLCSIVVPAAAGRWRMYYEARGLAEEPTVIGSAISDDMLNWSIEPGIRIASPGGVGGPRYLALGDGRARMYYIESVYAPPGKKGGVRLTQSVASAITTDGIHFTREPGYRMRDRQGVYDDVGITAGEVLAPVRPGDDWTMIFSAWQDVPKGKAAPVHPSHDVAGEAKGVISDFATASIAADLAGYRSRIYAAASPDGLNWGKSHLILEGGGYDSDGIDAVHAEDMSLTKTADGRYRMYYAACDRRGNFRIASAVTDTG